jgi:hypothetical protein
MPEKQLSTLAELLVCRTAMPSHMSDPKGVNLRKHVVVVTAEATEFRALIFPIYRVSIFLEYSCSGLFLVGMNLNFASMKCLILSLFSYNSGMFLVLP